MENNKDYYMKVNILGRLYIKDIIIFYDEPLLFSCFNDLGNFFIVNCLDMNINQKEWLVLPISEAKLIKGLKGNISGYNLFKNSECGFLWKVIQYREKDICEAVYIQSEFLKENDLPDKDVYFNVYKDAYLPYYDNDILRDSAIERREIMDISFEPHGGHGHEIEASALGNLLDSTQKIINIIAHKQGVNSKVPTDIKDENKLIVAGHYAASFGVRLKSNRFADLLNESKIQQSISIFMDILEAKDDVENLINIFEKLNPAVSIKYKGLLKLLDKNDITLKTYCAFPNNKYRSISFSKSEIQNSIKCLEENVREIVKEVHLVGHVNAVDTVRKTFGFTTKNEEKITGIIGENVNIQQYILPKLAEVKIEMTSKLFNFSNKEKIKYTLLYLKYLD